VERAQRLDGIGGHRGGRRHVGQYPPVRAREAQLAIRLSLALVALFVDGAVVAATEQGEVRQRGGAAVGPVADVMSLSERHATAREAAALVPVVKRPP